MITAVLQQTTDTIPAVIPQLLIPSSRYYRQLCPRYRGITADYRHPHYRVAHYSSILLLQLSL